MDFGAMKIVAAFLRAFMALAFGAFVAFSALSQSVVTGGFVGDPDIAAITDSIKPGNVPSWNNVDKSNLPAECAPVVEGTLTDRVVVVTTGADVLVWSTDKAWDWLEQVAAGTKPDIWIIGQCA